MDPIFIGLGLVVGLLVGMTGVGAGSLVTPALVLSGVPAPLAIGTDLAYAAATKTAGALAHRAQRTVDLRLAGLLALGSVPAAALALAALAATGASARLSLVSLGLAFALVLTALALLAGRARVQAWAGRYEARIAPRRDQLTVLAGALLGLLVAVSSIGAGALGAVMLVALRPDLPAVRIAGTDIAHAVPLTLVAALGHFALGNVDLALAATLVAGAVPGIVAGSFLAGRLPEAFVRRALAFVLLYAGTRLAFASF